jgi:outer membrane protein assembly factor BamA
MALAAAAVLSAGAVPAATEPPMVTAVEIASGYPLQEGQVRATIGDLAGKPLSRDAVRASLDRLWGLRRFSTIRVEEIPNA